MKKVFAAICLIVLFLLAVKNNTAGNESIQYNEQNNCQYSYRANNPEGGCNNIDPCDPQNAVKGGTGDCSTISEEKSMSYNIKEVEKAVESVGK